MTEHKYLQSNEPDEVNRKQLELNEQILDPTTIRHLEKLGVTVGWKCLEVGAGRGSIVKWLANRVGPKGFVVATDINTRFLQLLNSKNVEIRQHDILKDDLEIEKFDLVHCRSILLHLTEPEKALRKMASAVHRGGWLMIEETDMASCLPVELTDPNTAVYTKTCRMLWDFLRERKLVDPYFGRRVRALIDELGYVDSGNEGSTWIGLGGSTEGLWRATAFRIAAKPMIAAGLLTQEQSDLVEQLYQNPTFYFLGPTQFSAWGKKPLE